MSNPFETGINEGASLLTQGINSFASATVIGS